MKKKSDDGRSAIGKKVTRSDRGKTKQAAVRAARNLNALVTARFIFCISAVKFGILTGSL